MTNAVDALHRGEFIDWMTDGIDVEGASSHDFVDSVGGRLTDLYRECTLAAFSEHHLTEGEQVDLLYTVGWGEWRSLKTFATQLARTDNENPLHHDLRSRLVKQMNDEFRHYQMADRALKRMGVTTPIRATKMHEKAASLVASFDYMDRTYTDPLLATSAIQFADERAPLVFEEVVSQLDWVHPVVRETLGAIVPDEVFHVSIGFEGMKLIAEQGVAQRRQALTWIADVVGRFTLPKLTAGRIGLTQ
jgi:hypothetical protein